MRARVLMAWAPTAAPVPWATPAKTVRYSTPPRLPWGLCLVSRQDEPFRIEDHGSQVVPEISLGHLDS